MIRDNITLYQNYNNLSIKCYCCNYNNHIAKNCPMVHVIINPQRVIRDHIKIEPTSRRQFPRFQKKFNAMTHLEAMIRACIKLHRTTTLEISTYTIEQDEEEEEDDKEEEPDLSPSKNLSQFRRFGSNNPHSLQNITAIRSKTSLKNTQGVSEENTPDDKDNKKYFNWERRGRREHNLTQNNMMGTTITNKQVGGTFISGSVGFETYISNMNTVIENERVPSPLLKRKKRPSTQTITPKTSGTELKRDGSISPLKKKSQNMTEIDGRYQEHQKLVAEALMLQGISNTGPQENFIKLSYNELLNQFDKLKNFEIYFPYNNVDMIVEIIKTWQKNAALKKRKSRIKKNVTGHQNFSTLYNQMTFNQVFKKDTINTHNSNYEDLMYRRALTQNEGSPAKKLRLLPTKSLNFNKGINAIKQNLKKSQKMRKKIKKSGFWMCFTCKKKMTH